MPPFPLSPKICAALLRELKLTHVTRVSAVLRRLTRPLERAEVAGSWGGSVWYLGWAWRPSIPPVVSDLRRPGPSRFRILFAFFLKASYHAGVKRGAAFDSSFWVHAVFLDLVEFLLADYELLCPTAVEDELGHRNPTSRRLKALLAEGRIRRDTPKSEKVTLYGNGERAAINLALERRLLLLIDDWKPYEAAQLAGVEVVNSLVYLVRLYEQERVELEQVMNGLARMGRRGTVRSEWILSALKLVAELRTRNRKTGGAR